MTKQFFFNIALIAIIAFPCNAQTERVYPEPLNFKGIYRFDFSGIPLGQMGIEITQSPRHYDIAADVTTTGIAKIFVKHTSHTTVSGSGEQDFVYGQATYESHYQTKNKKKYVKMLTQNGVTGNATLIPSDNATTRPPVPVERKRNVADPLTVILRMREEVWKAQKNHSNQFTIPLYDGRRLTEVDFAVIGKQTLRYKGNTVPVITVAISRKLLAGFTKQELDDYNPNEPTARLYFTDNALLIPIHAEFSLLLGTASATLVKECANGESCLLGIKE